MGIKKYNIKEGQIYGKLTTKEEILIIEEKRRKWLCECSCENTILVRPDYLIKGNVKTCGKCLNKYIFYENYVEGVSINNDNAKFKIDLDDFDRVSKIPWKSKNNYFYTDSNTYNKNTKKYKPLFLHRFILNADDNNLVDHINHDTSDNRKCNLRLVNHSQNMMNTKTRKDNTSGYKGVYWIKKRKKWLVQIRAYNKVLYNKLFNNLEEAVLKRRELEEMYFGEYQYK